MSKDPDHMKILGFTNHTASHIWRFDPIVRRFNERTKHEFYLTTSDQWNNDTIGADLVIFELIMSPYAVDNCHNMGAKVIYEADDAFVDAYGKERKNLMHLDDKQRQETIKAIRKCDGITVTSQELADHYKQFTDKPIFVLPILMDYEYYGDVAALNMPERNTDEVRIGWFGSKGHFEDLRMVLPAIKNVLDKYPQAKFIYCGYGGMESERLSMQVQWGEDVFKEIPRDRREFHPGVPQEYWKYKHRFLDLDIGLAPLVDDDFNKHKVGTKWLEYSVLDTPSICSSTVYENYVTDGKTGVLAKSVKDWEEALSKMVEDEQHRKKIGENAAKDVAQNWNIENHWRDWERAYQHILNT